VRSTSTPKDTIHQEGTLRLYRFRAADGAAPSTAHAPVLLVPSLINRWHVLDLRPGASVVEALVSAGLEVYCIDWGAPQDEDRYLSWDDVVAKLGRVVRLVKRRTSAKKLSILGYCVGGTLSTIYTALRPEDAAYLVNLAGPIDFSESGFLGLMADERWFNAEDVANAGNVMPEQMQAGFVMLRPTLQLGKWVALADRMWDPEGREAFQALDGWSSDNIPFPGAAYARYIGELYQQNQLVAGQHYIAGERVDLAKITCPVMTVIASKDTICPPPAATALNAKVSSKKQEVFTIPGGHVGAVVGSKAKSTLYPKLVEAFKSVPRTAAVETKPPQLALS
jgi:polyhydroxyalkanoate synthase